MQYTLALLYVTFHSFSVNKPIKIFLFMLKSLAIFQPSSPYILLPSPMISLVSVPLISGFAVWTQITLHELVEPDILYAMNTNNKT